MSAMLKLTIGCLLGLFLAAPALARDAESVLIVSIDALHPDALDEQTAPTLRAMMRPGHYTLAGRSVDPPKTLIAHTTMFTGLAPTDSGKLDNEWQPGTPRVTKATWFDDAKQRGFSTAFYYAKTKLGYLVSGAVDEHGLERDAGIDKARAFFRQGGRRFAVLHVSGLEDAGTESGWLSPEYREELTYIDKALGPLFEDVGRRGAHVIVVTSDHAGHGRLHGTQHPDDFKVPLIVSSNLSHTPPVPQGRWSITGLRSMVREFLGLM